MVNMITKCCFSLFCSLRCSFLSTFNSSVECQLCPVVLCDDLHFALAQSLSSTRTVYYYFIVDTIYLASASAETDGVLLEHKITVKASCTNIKYILSSQFFLVFV